MLALKKKKLNQIKRKQGARNKKMAEKKKMTNAEVDKKLVDLKLELLKNTNKRKSIKREIARALTMKNQNKLMENKK